jgi:L-lactate dehydrogenase
MAEHFNGILLLTTNPVDVLTYVTQKQTGLPAGQIIGAGTLIDTERLRGMLGDALHIDARSVQATVIGEHGDSSVGVWSAAQIAGVPLALYPRTRSLPPLDDVMSLVRGAGPEVVALKGNTCFAIATCVIHICEAIVRDERSILVVSTLLTGQYGLGDVCLSTPCIVGSKGVEAVLELDLNPVEQKAIEASADILQRAYAGLQES